MSDTGQLDKIGTRVLLIQHLSSSWNSRSADFAFYLIFITLFQTSLLPSSLYGFFTTAVAIVWASSMGKIVERSPHLRSVRSFILAQKLSASIAYAAFLLMILKYPPNGISPQAGVWLLYTLICLAGGALKLSTIGINVAVEREWATLIAKDANLTKLNAYMRRIDLLSKLVAPLFVSLLTSTRGYSFAVIFLASFAVGCGIFEFFWIQVVYNRFDVLRRDDERKKQVQEDRIEQTRSLKRWLTEEIRLWRKFSDDPAFFTSVAISLLYITVLSFEGAMIGYLVWRGFSDPFIGAMRAVNVITGLLGTVLGPQLIKKVGLVRAGNWSIWSETVSLIPVVISFFLTPQYRGDTSPVYTSVLLFTGMALSRAPLWMFDLTQLQIVQESFNAEDRASLMSLQFSLQNMGDLLQYVITLIIRDPAQFRYAALISFICVAAGALVYSIGYARRVRGHLFHRVRLLPKN